jgi:hypothetical protein
MEKTATGIRDVGTMCYNPGMAEKKESYPMRATQTWAEMVKNQALLETRPANNLIERVMVAYCNDPAIRELVQKYEDRTPPSSD